MTEVDIDLDKDTILDLLDEIDEFRELHEAMQDDTLDEAMAYVVKCIEKPDVPAKQVAQVIVKLQALSASFALKSTFYKGFGKSGTEERYRKDVFYTARDAIDKLVNALKYIERGQSTGF